ncbi:prepilin peptidase [Hazenella sp. IB182357]|uniref:Prepilin peptidase n=1 Tax=Polycladospora coralii TaxID=2771432 RepID=A0A926RU32_9BACL|nr:A24 family peptidase [Polycladospora coralii]MBD1372433.1 prepilin peptidase [Polycladospora coralii]MBS7531755.1 prepilin peptidase [Polycladospora coralii]
MWHHILYLTLIGILLAATITDIKGRIILNRFSISGMIVATIVHLIDPALSWWNYILTGSIVFILLFLVAVITGERSIGGGDVKLFGMLGFAVGWPDFLLLFILSHLLGAAYILIRKLMLWKQINRHTEFAFAPFILVATVILYLWKWL